MSKKVEIKNCNNCPHMNNMYYTYERECMLLDRVLDSQVCDIYNEIYEGCPLSDWDEVPKEKIKTRIAIIGSRTFNDYENLQCFMDEVLEKHNLTTEDIVIVSGGAKGADSLGKRYSEDYMTDYVEYEANWKDLSHPDAIIRTNSYGKYDAKAGIRRNTLIIEDADIVVAFHNGSKGTADSLNKARKLNKRIEEWKF